MARPSKYKKEYCELATNYCLLGATNEELAQFFEVAVSTVDKWIAEHKEFSGAIKAGKDQADANVAGRLYSRALGYSHPEDKIFNNNGEAIIVPTTKHYPPDATSAIFWLKNRQKGKWRDKHEVDLNTKVTFNMDYSLEDEDD